MIELTLFFILLVLLFGARRVLGAAAIGFVGTVVLGIMLLMLVAS